MRERIRVLGHDPGFVSEQLLESVASTCASRPVLYHLKDLRLGARVLHDPVLVARPFPVVVLHEPRIPHAIVCCFHSHTAARFLNDCGEDVARVDASLGGHRRDKGLD
jgi:hypothetical protein